MTFHPREQIARYLDGELTPPEQLEFERWLNSSPIHLQELARASLLHDRLRDELHARQVANALSGDQPARPATSGGQGPRLMAVLGAVAAVFVGLAVVWLGGRGTPVSAATELNRLIKAQHELGVDRTYRLSVEEVALPEPGQRQRPEENRPPKPPLDGAILHVRRRNQFVLIRPMPGGQTFVTGSDGRTSWAIRPDGPVRLSTDLTRFNRDLPGHEHKIPLIDVEHGLEHLRTAYDVQVLPIEEENPESGTQGGISEPTRLLVAVKKRGSRGPKRVEITYSVQTRQIHQIRFVDMPYGPERLTVRLTLVEERNQGPGFFSPGAHHAADRTMEEE